MHSQNKHPANTNSRYSGFTLLEVMVAVFVLGVAAAAIVQATSASIRHADAITERQLALWVANNTMTMAMLPESPTNQEGSSSFGGYTYNWQLRAEHTSTDNFQRLSVKVFRPNSQNHYLAQLTGFKFTE
ncbi:type II secretion system minor pseudopilin GspI [Aliamphritea ceti]|uniref:type II secretion system minor pseudopilin GspI n=1 Tax=Aliamphritea ceti TaxID=1524258 RepID=UPI0021C45898|nr:type II secretion system minor pseudopilin GspI [Aliamphritea ceti]